MATPRVSVIIPTYNRKDYVQLTLDSALAQTYRDFEIIVLDDGSTDGTGEALAMRYGGRIHYERQENQGESAARNRALQMARGEYIALLDSDDLWLPAKLAKQVSILDGDAEIGLVFCQAWLIDKQGQRISEQPEGYGLTLGDLALDKMVFVNQIGGPSTTLLRRETLNAVGGFDSQIRFGEDWDLWLQMLVRQYRIAFIAEPLTCIRRHRGTQCYYPSAARNEQRRNEHLRLLNKAFEQWPGPIPTGLRERALACQYAETFLAELAVNNLAGAQGNLKSTIQLAPETLHDPQDFGQTIVNNTAVIAEETEAGSFDRAAAYVRQVMALLHEAGQRDEKFARVVSARAYATIGFIAHDRDASRAAGHYVWQALRQDSTWLRNGGARSILMEGIIGKSLARFARRITAALKQNGHEAGSVT